MRQNRFTKILLCLFVAAGSSLRTLAADNTTSYPFVDDNFNGLAWTLAALVLLLVFGLVFLLVRFGSLGAAEQPAATSFRQWWACLNARFLTKAIPLEKEADHLLDHDYDGIQELDNSLPPWWKYGFYLSIVFAVFYMLRFHVWKTGPDPEQEYQTEMQLAAKQIEDYRQKTGDLVDEKTVTLADAAGIAEGQKIYQSNCFACHGAQGEGGIGPNLTDKFWLHGGSLNDIFKTIKFGVPEKGMQAWEKTYSPTQIKNIASYVKSLAGTNPPNAKAPQGEPYEEKTEEAKPLNNDSTAIAKHE